MSRAAIWLMLGLATTASFASRANAHESRPLYVEVTEKAPLVFSIRWKIPPSIEIANAPEVSMTGGCTSSTPPSPGGTRASIQQRSYQCETDPGGSLLHIHYALYNPSVSALVRVTRLSGEEYSLIASPEENEVVLPQSESFGGIARDYLALGVRHILEGYDHLLFLVCLMLIAGTGRRILITITGFTLAHSVTLALSALGLVRVPVAPVEAAIALSIVFLALEIVRGNPESLTYRHPIAVSCSFGLLHGFGFAAVLGETGLPQTEIPAALLFFNLGVEVGQLIFVLSVILVYHLARFGARTLAGTELSLDRLRPFETPAAYAVGILASFWMIQRVATFWVS